MCPASARGQPSTKAAELRLRLGRRHIHCTHASRGPGPTGLEDGGFRGLPGGQRRDASAPVQPPLGEVAARAQGYGTWCLGTRTGSRLLGEARSRLARSRGQGHGKVTAQDRDESLSAGLGAGTGIPQRAWELRNDPQTQSSVPAASFQQPALLKSPTSRSIATFAQALQNVPETQVSLLDNGLRVASEQSSQPTCTVSWGPLSRGCLHIGCGVFPGRDVTLGSSLLWFGVRLLLIHRYSDPLTPIPTPDLP